MTMRCGPLAGHGTKVSWSGIYRQAHHYASLRVVRDKSAALSGSQWGEFQLIRKTVNVST